MSYLQFPEPGRSRLVPLNRFAKRVVIVEDNPLNMKLFKDLLEAYGCIAIAVTRGDEAVSVIRRSLPDLVLMDIQLPKVSGLEITRELKADVVTADIPIIAITAFSRKSDEEEIRASGCNAYLSKPISVAGFIQTIVTFLDL